MRPKRLTLTLAAADRDGVCTAQTLGGAGALTIDGALATDGVATMDAPRHVSIYCAADISGVTFTVDGTDRHGNTVTEDISGPTAGVTVTGEINFDTITGVSADGAVGTNVEVGSADEADGPWVPLCHRTSPFEIGIGCILAPAGSTLTFGIEITNDDVQAEGFLEHQAEAIAHATITGESANVLGEQAAPVTAIRLAVTGHTDGGVTTTITQAG